MNSLELSQKIMDLLDEKKALDILSIDVRKVTTLTDFFVICSGTSDRHRKSLADEISEQMDKKDVKMLSKEGYNHADWILLDFGDVVIHVFDQEARTKYNLERLWSDGVLSEQRRGDQL